MSNTVFQWFFLEGVCRTLFIILPCQTPFSSVFFEGAVRNTWFWFLLDKSVFKVFLGYLKLLICNFIVRLVIFRLIYWNVSNSGFVQKFWVGGTISWHKWYVESCRERLLVTFQNWFMVKKSNHSYEVFRLIDTSFNDLT